LVVYFAFIGLFVWHSAMILNFHEYTVWDSNIFYDLKELGEVDVSELLKDFTFGF